MMFTLYGADVRENKYNTQYPHPFQIKEPADMEKATARDYVAAQYKGDHRANENFIKSDCVALDCDNKGDDPGKWLTPEQLRGIFPGVAFAVHYSRHNQKERNGDPPAPRFHAFFPSNEIRDPVKYANIKQAVAEIVPELDPAALDSGRFFYGTDPPQVEFFPGNIKIDDFLTAQGVDLDARPDLAAYNYTNPGASGQAGPVVFLTGGTIPKGQRHATLLKGAMHYLKRYGDTSEAAQRFAGLVDQCAEQLPRAELDGIWRDALRYYNGEIAGDPEYLTPDAYAAKCELTRQAISIFKRCGDTQAAADGYGKKAASYQLPARVVSDAWNDARRYYLDNIAGRPGYVAPDQYGTPNPETRETWDGENEGDDPPAAPDQTENPEKSPEPLAGAPEKDETPAGGTDTPDEQNGAETPAETAGNGKNEGDEQKPIAFKGDAAKIDAFTHEIFTERFRPIPSGVPTLDKLLNGGFLRGTVILVEAEPGAGKTAICAEMCENMAKNGEYCVFLNLEMSKTQIFARSLSRMIYQKRGVRLSALDILQAYRADEKTAALIMDAAETYKNEVAPFLEVNPSETKNLKTIIDGMDRIAIYQKQHGRAPAHLFIDYLQLIETDPRDDAAETIKKCMAALKGYAIRENVVVVAPVATNRAASKSKKASMDAGRDSSGLEFGADVILQLIRESETDDDPNAGNYVHMLVTKSRFTASSLKRGQRFYFHGAQSYLEPVDETREIDGQQTF